MSEKKIQVPEGMAKAASDATAAFSMCHVMKCLEAAMLWLAEHPIVPTEEQALNMWMKKKLPFEQWEWVRWGASEWQRRMFAAPEPEVPEAIKDLLSEKVGGTLDGVPDADERVMEAYRRGKESAK
jgi:hypothetical protein